MSDEHHGFDISTSISVPTPPREEPEYYFEPGKDPIRQARDEYGNSNSSNVEPSNSSRSFGIQPDQNLLEEQRESAEEQDVARVDDDSSKDDRSKSTRSFGIGPDTNPITEQREQAEQRDATRLDDSAASKSTRSFGIEPDHDPIREQREQAKQRDAVRADDSHISDSTSSFNIEPDQDPLREQRERANQEVRGYTDSGESDNEPKKHPGLHERRHGIPEAMIFKTRPIQAARAGQPGFHSSPTDSKDGLSTESALNSFSPGSYERRVDSFASGKYVPAIGGEQSPSSDTSKAPLVFLEIQVKQYLLPAAQLLHTNSSPSVARVALHLAQTAYRLASSNNPSISLLGKCAYYIGVAEYILAVAKSNNTIFYHEYPLKYFRIARKAESPECDWAKTWFVYMNKLLSEKLSPHQHEPPSASDSPQWTRLPWRWGGRGDQAAERNAGNERAERNAANERKLSAMSGSSWDFIKGFLKEVRKRVWDGDQADLDYGDLIGGGSEKDGSSLGTAPRQVGEVKYNKHRKFGINPEVVSPDRFSDGWNGPQTFGPHGLPEVWRREEEARQREFLRQQEAARQQQELMRRQQGRQEAQRGDAETSDWSEESQRPVEPPPRTGLRVVNRTSQDHIDSSSSGASKKAGPSAHISPSKKASDGSSESQPPIEPPQTGGGLRVVNWTNQDHVSSSSSSGASKKGVPSAHTPSAQNAPNTSAHRRARSAIEAPSNNHNRRKSLRQIFLPQLTLVNDNNSRSEEALAEEGVSPVFKPTDFGNEESRIGLVRRKTYGGKSAEELAEEGVSPTFVKGKGL